MSGGVARRGRDTALKGNTDLQDPPAARLPPPPSGCQGSALNWLSLVWTKAWYFQVQHHQSAFLHMVDWEIRELGLSRSMAHAIDLEFGKLGTKTYCVCLQGV